MKADPVRSLVAMCTGQPVGASPMAVERKRMFSDGMAVLYSERGVKIEVDRVTPRPKQRQGQQKLMEVAVWIQQVSQTRSEPDRQNTRGKGTKKWW